MIDKQIRTGLYHKYDSLLTYPIFNNFNESEDNFKNILVPIWDSILNLFDNYFMIPSGYMSNKVKLHPSINKQTKVSGGEIIINSINKWLKIIFILFIIILIIILIIKIIKTNKFKLKFL